MEKLTWQLIKKITSSSPIVNRIGIFGDWYPGLTDIRSDRMSKVFENSLDHLIVNLECCISDSLLGPRSKNGPNLIVPTKALSSFDGQAHKIWMALANNHSFDFGAEGLKSTFRALKDKGFQAMGAGFDATSAWMPAHLELANGKKLAVINFCEGEDRSGAYLGNPGVASFRPLVAANQVRKEKSAGNFVIVFFHGGREGLRLPPPYIQELFRELAQVGADLVIGHHPHVPQAWEYHESSILFYSLGHSLFRYAEGGPLDSYGLALELGFDSNSSLQSLKLSPVKKNNGSLELLSKNHRLGKYLESGARILSDSRWVHLAWEWEALYQKRRGQPYLKRMALDSLGSLLGLKSSQVRLRNSFYTDAHRHFIEECLSVNLESSGASLPLELEAFLLDDLLKKVAE